MAISLESPALVRALLALLVGLALGLALGGAALTWWVHCALVSIQEGSSPWVLTVLDAIAEVRDGS